jgi:hypothetical protein
MSAPEESLSVLFITGSQSERNGSGQHARNAPETNAGVEQDGERPGRLPHGRFTAEVKGFIESNADGKREIVVSEFAEEQAVERTAIGDIGDAADGEFFALGEPARKADGGHEFARGASDRPIFAIATEFFD